MCGVAIATVDTGAGTALQVPLGRSLQIRSFEGQPPGLKPTSRTPKLGKECALCPLHFFVGRVRKVVAPPYSIEKGRWSCEHRVLHTELCWLVGTAILSEDQGKALQCGSQLPCCSLHNVGQSISNGFQLSFLMAITGVGVSFGCIQKDFWERRVPHCSAGPQG